MAKISLDKVMTKPVSRKPTTKKAANLRDEVEIEALNAYAAVDAVEKALEAVKEHYKAAVYDAITDYMIEKGLQYKAQPKSFTGSGDHATANCQLKKRSSRSVLVDSDCEQLDELGVPYDTIEDVVETIRINPKYMSDRKLLEKAVAALNKANLPEDLIELQHGETRRVVSDESLKTAFSTLNAEQLQEALSIIGTRAVKPQFKGNTTDALQYLIDEGILTQ